MVVLTSFAPPNEGVRHQQPDTSVIMQNKDLGKGTLYIAESRLSWVNSGSGEGFSLEYPHIILHAVARTPIEYMLVMLDSALPLDEGETRESDSESDENNSTGGGTEVKLIPDDKAALESMYRAMNECQALHPDPNSSISDQEEDIFEDADADGEEGEYNIQAGAGAEEENEDFEEASEYNGRHQEESMETDAGQFEDADNDVNN